MALSTEGMRGRTGEAIALEVLGVSGVIRHLR